MYFKNLVIKNLLISSLRQLKTFMLSRMEQERRDGLAWILVHHGITMDVNDVINMLANLHSVRIKLVTFYTVRSKYLTTKLNEKDLI